MMPPRMANERFIVGIHIPPSEESVPAFLTLRPRSMYSLYKSRRWSGSRSEALRAHQRVDLEKGGELSVAFLLRTKTQIIRQ